jgi:hypothetical protein
MKGVDCMKSKSTEMFYNEHKYLSYEELNERKHKCSNRLSELYHEMSMAIFNNEKEKFNLLNNESINTHNELSAIQIILNHKETGLI